MNLPKRYKAEACYNKKPILVILPSNIGDAVLCSGIFNYIALKKPGTKVIIAASSMVGPLFSDYPDLDYVYPFEKQTHSGHWFDLWKTFRKIDFEWIIDCRGSLTSYLLTTDKRIIWSQKKYDGGHKVEQISKMFGKNPLPPHLSISPERIERVRDALQAHDKPYICISTVANWQGKEWPVDYWLEILSNIKKHKPSYRVYALASANKRDALLPLQEKFPDMVTLVADANFSLLDCAALIQGATCFIGNDSGLMHMSVAVKTPTIALIGPSRDEVYGPYGLDRNGKPQTGLRIDMTYDGLIKTPGFSLSHPTDNYMESLKPEKVWGALERIL